MLLLLRSPVSSTPPSGPGPVVSGLDDIHLFIGGVEQNGVIATLHIRKTTNGVATANCEIDSVDGSYVPALDDEVIIEVEGIRRFGGIIVDPATSGLAGLPMGASITTSFVAHGFAVRAEHAVAQGSYPSGTLKSKLQQLLADTVNPLPGITLHASQADGPTLDDESFDYVKTKEVLDEWTRLSGWPWVIDDYAVLRFIEPGILSAAFDIVDGDGKTVGDITVKPTRSEYHNRVIVRAGDLVGIAEDAAEIAAHGLWAVKVLAPDEVATQAAVDDLATAILSRSIVELTDLEYDTKEDWLNPGETQSITLADRNVSNFFLINDAESWLEADYFRHSIKATEGMIFGTGWREQFRNMFGAGGMSIGGFVGGGVTFVRPVFFLGGTGVNAVRTPAANTWIAASPIRKRINTVTRGTTSATIVGRLRARNAGVSIQARLYDVTDDVACSGPSGGLSAEITSTSWQPVAWTVTLTPGEHDYELQIKMSAAQEDGFAVADLQ